MKKWFDTPELRYIYVQDFIVTSGENDENQNGDGVNTEGTP